MNAVLSWVQSIFGMGLMHVVSVIQFYTCFTIIPIDIRHVLHGAIGAYDMPGVFNVPIINYGYRSATSVNLKDDSRFLNMGPFAIKNTDNHIPNPAILNPISIEIPFWKKNLYGKYGVELFVDPVDFLNTVFMGDFGYIMFSSPKISLYTPEFYDRKMSKLYNIKIRCRLNFNPHTILHLMGYLSNTVHDFLKNRYAQIYETFKDRYFDRFPIGVQKIAHTTTKQVLNPAPYLAQNTQSQTSEDKFSESEQNKALIFVKSDSGNLVQNIELPENDLGLQRYTKKIIEKFGPEAKEIIRATPIEHFAGRTEAKEHMLNTIKMESAGSSLPARLTGKQDSHLKSPTLGRTHFGEHVGTYFDAMAGLYIEMLESLGTHLKNFACGKISDADQMESVNVLRNVVVILFGSSDGAIEEFNESVFGDSVKDIYANMDHILANIFQKLENIERKVTDGIPPIVQQKSFSFPGATSRTIDHMLVDLKVSMQMNMLIHRLFLMGDGEDREWYDKESIKKVRHTQNIAEFLGASLQSSIYQQMAGSLDSGEDDDWRSKAKLSNDVDDVALIVDTYIADALYYLEILGSKATLNKYFFNYENVSPKIKALARNAIRILVPPVVGPHKLLHKKSYDAEEEADLHRKYPESKYLVYGLRSPLKKRSQFNMGNNNNACYVGVTNAICLGMPICYTKDILSEASQRKFVEKLLRENVIIEADNIFPVEALALVSPRNFFEMNDFYISEIMKRCGFENHLIKVRKNIKPSATISFANRLGNMVETLLYEEDRHEMCIREIDFANDLMISIVKSLGLSDSNGNRKEMMEHPADVEHPDEIIYLNGDVKRTIVNFFSDAKKHVMKSELNVERMPPIHRCIRDSYAKSDENAAETIHEGEICPKVDAIYHDGEMIDRPRSYHEGEMIDRPRSDDDSAFSEIGMMREINPSVDDLADYGKSLYSKMLQDVFALADNLTGFYDDLIKEGKQASKAEMISYCMSGINQNFCSKLNGFLLCMKGIKFIDDDFKMVISRKELSKLVDFYDIDVTPKQEEQIGVLPWNPIRIICAEKLSRFLKTKNIKSLSVGDGVEDEFDLDRMSLFTCMYLKHMEATVFGQTFDGTFDEQSNRTGLKIEDGAIEAAYIYSVGNAASAAMIDFKRNDQMPIRDYSMYFLHLRTLDFLLKSSMRLVQMMPDLKNMTDAETSRFTQDTMSAYKPSQNQMSKHLDALKKQFAQIENSSAKEFLALIIRYVEIQSIYEGPNKLLLESGEKGRGPKKLRNQEYTDKYDVELKTSEDILTLRKEEAEERNKLMLSAAEDRVTRLERLLPSTSKPESGEMTAKDEKSSSKGKSSQGKTSAEKDEPSSQQPVSDDDFDANIPAADKYIDVQHVTYSDRDYIHGFKGRNAKDDFIKSMFNNHPICTLSCSLFTEKNLVMFDFGIKFTLTPNFIKYLSKFDFSDTFNGIIISSLSTYTSARLIMT